MAHVAIINDETGLIENMAEVEDGANWSPPNGKRTLRMLGVYEAAIGWIHNKTTGQFNAPVLPDVPPNLPEEAAP
jgi:hypothetical protein